MPQQVDARIVKDDPNNVGQEAKFAKLNSDGGMEVHLVGGAISGTITTTQDGLPSTAISQFDVSTTEVATPASNLASRKTLSVKALAANAVPVYVGLAGVTALTGYELSPGDSVEIDADATVAYFTIAASGTQRVCTLEVA